MSLKRVGLEPESTKKSCNLKIFSLKLELKAALKVQPIFSFILLTP